MLPLHPCNSKKKSKFTTNNEVHRRVERGGRRRVKAAPTIHITRCSYHSRCVPHLPNGPVALFFTAYSYYERLPGGVNSIFSPGDSGGMAELVDLRVYVGVYEKGETIPFDDAIPLSIT